MEKKKTVSYAMMCVSFVGATLFAGTGNFLQDRREQGDTSRFRGDVRNEKRIEARRRAARTQSSTSAQVGMARMSAMFARPPMFFQGISDLAVYDGKAYVVGGFNRVSQEPMGYGIPVDKVTGQAIADFDPVNGKVENVVEDGAGGWFINGYFSRVGTTARAGFAHILPNGKVDPNWNLSVKSGEFGEMAYFSGKLYVEVASNPSENLSKVELHCYNTTTRRLEKNWTLYEGDSDSYPSINSIKATTGRVYIGGEFTSLNGQPHNNIAALDTESGNILNGWSGGTDGVVEDIAVTINAVFAGGRFSKANNNERLGVAAFLPKDGTLLEWNARLGPQDSSPQVYTMGFIGATLYLGGSFYEVDGHKVHGFTGVNINSGQIVPMDNGDCGYVSNIGVGDNSVYLGFSGECEVQGEARQGYGALTTNGSLAPWAPSGNSPTREIVPGSQAVFLVVDAGFLGGTRGYGFAVYDVNTGNLEDYTPVPPGHSLLLDGNILYVGGYAFSAVDLLTKSVRPFPEVSGRIDAMVKKGDVLYIGGQFDSVGGEPRSNLAAVNTKGELLPWAPQLKTVDYESGVASMVVFGDQIIVAGKFISVNDLPRKNAAAITADGTLQDWAPDFDDKIYNLAVDGSSVYVVGQFSDVTLDGQLSERGGFAEFVGSGLALSNWDPRLTYDGWFPGQVHSVAAFNGVLYVVGEFNQVGTIARNATAAFRISDGALVPWDADLGVSIFSSFMHVAWDRVYIGGYNITSANGQIQGGLAVVGLASAASVPPAAPERLVVPQRSSTTLSMQWDAIASATSYSLKVLPLGTPLLIPNLTTAFTLLDSLTPNTKYTVGVKACNAAGCSSYSTIEANTWAAVPGLSTTSVQGTSIGLKIATNGNPTGTIYVLQQADSPDGPFGKEKTTDGTDVIVDLLSPDTNYSFRIFAKNFDGSNTDYSTVLTVKTGFESKLRSSSIGVVSNTSISASWDFDIPGTTYRLVASTRTVNPLESFVRVQEVSEQAGTLAALSPNTWYSLFVQTCAEGRCSNFDSIGFKTTLANVPSLVADTSNPREPSLRINANGNPDGTLYVVEKSEDGGNTFVTFIETVGLEVDTSDLPVGKTFQFRVSAKNSEGKMTAPSAVTPFETNVFSIDQARAYPVPFRPGQGKDVITFDSFPVGSTLRLYTMRGELVRTMTPDASFYEWDVRNQEGTAVASGVYLVRVSGSGGHKTFKIVVQR